MSGEEGLKEVFDEPEDPIDNPEPIESEHEDPTEKVAVSEDEEKARKGGWRPREEFEGDPNEWVSAKKFNDFGDLIGTIKSTKKEISNMRDDFDDRLKAQKKLADLQRKAMLKDLESKRNDAIEIADKDSALEYQAQINDLDSEPVADHPKEDTSGQSLLDEYNSANPWIFDTDSPKAAYAMNRFGSLNRSHSVAESLEILKADIKRHFPEVNPNRDAPATTEKRRSSNPKRESKLQWGDLTRDELTMYKEFSSEFTKDQWLTTVADERKSRS